MWCLGQGVYFLEWRKPSCELQGICKNIWIWKRQSSFYCGFGKRCPGPGSKNRKKNCSFTRENSFDFPWLYKIKKPPKSIKEERHPAFVLFLRNQLFQLSKSESFRIGKWQNQKVSESEIVWIRKCQKHFGLESVKHVKCQKLLGLEIVRIRKCRNCSNWKDCDIFQFWTSPIHAVSDTFQTWWILILSYFGQLWHFSILTLFYSDNFLLRHFPTPTLPILHKKWLGHTKCLRVENKIKGTTFERRAAQGWTRYWCWHSL